MEILTKEQLADYLKVDLNTVKNLLYRKKLPKVKIGKEFRFLKDDIDNWLLSQREQPSQNRFNPKRLSR